MGLIDRRILQKKYISKLRAMYYRSRSEQYNIFNQGIVYDLYSHPVKDDQFTKSPKSHTGQDSTPQRNNAHET